MAEAAGMKPDDVLAAIDDRPVPTHAELRAALRVPRGTRSVKLRFEREGETFEASVEPVFAALEAGILYDTIERDGSRLRTIVDPSTGPARRPAILFVQGLSTDSIERAFPQLFRGLSDEGFVTMRLERRGVGDSEGEPPERGDFATEVADVRAALSALGSYDFVDPEAVFVLGHSIGGMIAPKLEAGDRVRGYVTYGSSAEPWFDCLEASARRQWRLRGEDDGEPRAAAFRAAIRTEPILDGRSALYHRQLHEAEIATAWSRVERPVHVLHGEHDWVVSEAENRHLAEIARGSFEAIPRLDHLFGAHDSVEESVKSYGRGRFEPEIIRATCAWMRAATRVGSARGPG